MPKIHEYFARGFRRSGNPLPPRQGKTIRGNEKLLARFYLDIQDDCIEIVSYKCSTCVVLVAYCEHLAELVSGLSLEEAGRITPEVLIGAFPEAPAYRHDRAILALKALRSAVHVAESDVGEKQTR